jgi:uncharacterized protein YjbJ (UPF0337 family)
MSATDKVRHAAEKAKGKAQEAKARVTGDRKEQMRGTATVTMSDVKQAAEKAMDAAKRMKDAASARARDARHG